MTTRDESLNSRLKMLLDSLKEIIGNDSIKSITLDWKTNNEGGVGNDPLPILKIEKKDK